ncbi:AI-2E family transporter [Aquimonas sp.]|jgi:predicted PurR-regulated permease PerM|uniref:AI-2E family transporter n=1 Tax=Aquimonas sp. TaxID=1872588 RepID=UPI0037BEAD21
MSHPAAIAPVLPAESRPGVESSPTDEPRPAAEPSPAAELNASPIRSRRGDTQRALWILCTLASLLAIYVAAPILLPVLIGGFLALLLNPLVRWLSAHLLPRWIAAMLVLGCVMGGLGLGASALSGPAIEAIEASPRVIQELQRRVQRMAQPLLSAGKFDEAMTAFDTLGGPPSPRPVTVTENRSSLGDRFGGVIALAASIGTALVLVYLFLVYGELLLRRVVTIAPTLRDKRNAVEIVRSIQSDISRYVVTVTMINLALGATIAGVLYLLGVREPLLWGAMTALLNFAPYIGPLLGAMVLLAVGILQFDTPGAALLPVAAYLGLNAIESELVTPLVLGRSFALNPVVILLWLLLWGWLWGALGMLLAMPMLVCAKIICSRYESLRAWSLMIER